MEIEIEDEDREEIAQEYLQEKYDLDIAGLGHIKRREAELQKELESATLEDPLSEDSTQCALLHIKCAMKRMELGWYDEALFHQRAAYKMLLIGGAED